MGFQVLRFRVLGFGAQGLRRKNPKSKFPNPNPKAQNSHHSGFGFRVYSLRFSYKDAGLGCRIRGVGFRICLRLRI